MGNSLYSPFKEKNKTIVAIENNNKRLCFPCLVNKKRAASEVFPSKGRKGQMAAEIQSNSITRAGGISNGRGIKDGPGTVMVSDILALLYNCTLFSI